jgi:hypothetical protein
MLVFLEIKVVKALASNGMAHQEELRFEDLAPEIALR